MQTEAYEEGKNWKYRCETHHNEDKSFPVKSIQKKPNSTWLKMNFSNSSHLWAIKKRNKISQQKWLAKILLGLLTNSPTWNKSDVVLNGKPQVRIFPHKSQNLPGPCIQQSLVCSSPLFFYSHEKPGWQNSVLHIRQTSGWSGRGNWGSSRLPVPVQLSLTVSDELLGGQTSSPALHWHLWG